MSSRAHDLPRAGSRAVHYALPAEGRGGPVTAPCVYSMVKEMKRASMAGTQHVGQVDSTCMPQTLHGAQKCCSDGAVKVQLP